MEIKSSNQSNEENFSESPKIKKNDFICKDGFCSISKKDTNASLKSQNNMNLFDPI